MRTLAVRFAGGCCAPPQPRMVTDRASTYAELSHAAGGAALIPRAEGARPAATLPREPKVFDPADYVLTPELVQVRVGLRKTQRTQAARLALPK